jgi:hypothetical protein
LAKERLEGDQAAIDEVPFPDSAADGDTPLKSPDTVRVPLRLPCAVGAKVTLMVQAAPTAKDGPQLLV